MKKNKFKISSVWHDSTNISDQNQFVQHSLKKKEKKESGIKTTKLSDQTVKLGISDQIRINILLLDSKGVQAGPCHLSMLSKNLEHKLGAILI